MRAIILAAGMGTRISKYIDEKPKCMVDIGGITLLEYTIDLLHNKGINDITICVGYKADFIENSINDKTVRFVCNPFYDVTNGIASIWFARDYIKDDEDLLIMSGDLYIESAIVDELISCDKSPVLLVDSSSVLDADYRFHYEDNILIRHGKDLTISDTTGENLGIAKLGKNFVKIYKNHMLEMIGQQKHSVWWESVMYDMLPITKIYVHDISGKFWSEVDQIEDYRKILKHRNIN